MNQPVHTHLFFFLVGIIAKFLLSWLALCINSNARRATISHRIQVCSSSFLTSVVVTMMKQVDSLTDEDGRASKEPVWRLSVTTSDRIGRMHPRGLEQNPLPFLSPTQPSLDTHSFCGTPPSPQEHTCFFKLSIFLGSKMTADGYCSHEIKRRLLLGRKAMTNLYSILKSRDITLPTKVHLVKAMVFPVVLHGCESWTTKKAEQ